jgi:hypothetical protein
MSAERAHGPLQILDIEPALLHACVILRTSIERDMENLERLIVAPSEQTRPDGFGSKRAFLSLGLKVILWPIGLYRHPSTKTGRFRPYLNQFSSGLEGGQFMKSFVGWCTFKFWDNY